LDMAIPLQFALRFDLSTGTVASRIIVVVTG